MNTTLSKAALRNALTRAAERLMLILLTWRFIAKTHSVIQDLALVYKSMDIKRIWYCSRIDLNIIGDKTYRKYIVTMLGQSEVSCVCVSVGLKHLRHHTHSRVFTAWVKDEKFSGLVSILPLPVISHEPCNPALQILPAWILPFIFLNSLLLLLTRRPTHRVLPGIRCTTQDSSKM